MRFHKHLAFKKKPKLDSRGNQIMVPLLLEELEAEFARTFDGTNFYYGINAANVQNFVNTKNALNPTHQAFYSHLLELLRQPHRDSITVMLGVEPPPTLHPYDFVSEKMDMVVDLATRLHEYQRSAPVGKKLEIVVRYASEMNDKKRTALDGHGNWYGMDPANFKRTYHDVRRAFRDHAPAVRFAFSPAIRADLAMNPGSMEADLSDYWPGTENVDILAGTWYVGDDGQFTACSAYLRQYILHRQALGLPFAIDELGGRASSGSNEKMLARMYQKLGEIGVDYEYATMFLEGKWGESASLAFLPQVSVV